MLRLWESSVNEQDPAPMEAGVDPELVRAANVLVALMLLLLTLPVLLLAMLAVRLTSRGPAIIRQVRVGMDRRYRDDLPRGRRSEDLGGRPFAILKLRTVYEEAVPNGKAEWATPDIPQVTPVGRVLRRTHLDKLPQLFNVLRGDMNLVGPSPEHPQIVRQRMAQVDNYHLRHRVRPGMTGLAQVSVPSDGSAEDVHRKVAYDLKYLSGRSVTGDLRILAKTVPTVLKLERKTA